MEGAITLNGCIAYDNDFLECINFPTLPDDVNERLQKTFYLKYYECPCLDTDIPCIKQKISIACEMLENEVVSTYNLMTAKYNPIENYDRTEETYKTSSMNTVGHGNGTAENETYGNSNRNESAESVSDSENLNKVEAFDTDVLKNHHSDTGKESAVTNTNNAEDYTNTGKQTTASTDDRQTDGNESTISHIHGNIGVMSTQDMILKSIEMLEKLDFFSRMTSKIKIKSEAFYYYFY